MKKILLIFILSFMPVLAYSININEHRDFLKTLNLSDKKMQKIEEIENSYNPEIVKLNSEIILNNMQCAQIKICNNLKIKALEDELQDITNQKNSEILSQLGWFQKRKYKKYINSHS